jgi:hypothetical protein
MHFCVRDDDTSFFTAPEVLERVYGEMSRRGPISLAVVPFHRAGASGGVPHEFRDRWSVHPLHQNKPLVEYLRTGVAENRFEIMLHGYHHDEGPGRLEFVHGPDLTRRVHDGRRYLEDLLGARIRVFVPPYNAIGRAGLRAVSRAGLHLAGTTGVRTGWSPMSWSTWACWWRLRRWRRSGGVGVPWVLNLDDHCELPGNPVTPTSRIGESLARFETTLKLKGAFCAATHYWEQDAPSVHPGDPPVGEHLHRLMNRALSDNRVKWRTVGDVLAEGKRIL